MDPRSDEDPQYDVFISYRHGAPDAPWVRGVLGPALTDAGLSVCLDHDSFRLGAPVLLEMERAVLSSARTVTVLTPRYLESRFGELENVLAETLGLERSERRLLAVMREPCTPPLRMRARLFLDMTDDATFEADVARLVEAVRMPA